MRSTGATSVRILMEESLQRVMTVNDVHNFMLLCLKFKTLRNKYPVFIMDVFKLLTKIAHTSKSSKAFIHTWAAPYDSI